MQQESLQLLKTKCINASDVMFIESSINYSVFHLKNGKRITVAKTLKKIQETTKAYNFIRVNRKCIVNLAFIEKKNWNINVNYLSLINGMPIYYSRRRITHSKKQIMLYFLN